MILKILLTTLVLGVAAYLGAYTFDPKTRDRRRETPTSIAVTGVIGFAVMVVSLVGLLIYGIWS